MHDVRFFERNVMGARPQPHSPWILFFDGATRDSGTNNHPAGIGAVLKNSRGHTVVELKKLVGPGVSSGVAKYKALIAGLKKVLSLGVEFLLVKGDSRLVHSQVVGHCSVQDERLVEYQRKVMTLSKDFRALFMERISREDNLRADRLANDAIDEELQVVDSLSEFIDQEWTSQGENLNNHSASQQHSTVHSRMPHSHPLPLPAPHLKVKPVASVSPHVVKRHVTESSTKAAIPAAIKSDDPSPGAQRRSRLVCSDADDSSQVEQMSSPVRNHVQAAAKSMRSTRRLLSSSPRRRPKISASLLPHWDNSHLDCSPFSEESTGTSQEGDSCNNKQQQQQQHGEANSASGSGTVTTTEQAGYDGARFDSLSSSSEEESASDAEFSEQDYARLVKTLLKGFLQGKKPMRS